MIKKLSLATLLATVTLCGGLAQAQPNGFKQLAGNWAGAGSATFSVCFNTDFSAVEDCTTAPNSSFWNQSTITQGTNDTNGNGCSTVTATNSPQFPNPVFPANAFTTIQVTKTTSFNPSTGSGTFSFTNYPAGSGTSCSGYVFVNTGNASPTSTGTSAFVLSQHGSRSDGVVLTIVGAPISDIDNFVGGGFSLRQ